MESQVNRSITFEFGYARDVTDMVTVMSGSDR